MYKSQKILHSTYILFIFTTNNIMANTFLNQKCYYLFLYYKHLRHFTKNVRRSRCHYVDYLIAFFGKPYHIYVHHVIWPVGYLWSTDQEVCVVNQEVCSIKKISYNDLKVHWLLAIISSLYCESLTLKKKKV